MTNKKNLIAFTLFLIVQHISISAQPPMGIEMTFPLSALLYILPGGGLAKVQTKISNAGGWGHNPYFHSEIGVLPQVDGYFATTDSFDLVLQPGTNQQRGFRNNHGPYASPIFYFSDVMRLVRDRNGNGTASAAPAKAYTRGQSPNNNTSMNNALYWCLYQSWGAEGMQAMKYTGLVSAKATTIDASSFKAVNGMPISYYFAQTGVDIYLPLHMITPGDDLKTADPDLLNFGPAPTQYNTPIPGDILPWTYKYIPKHLPITILKTEDF